MNRIFWILENVYGKLFGWSFFAPIHHAFINLSLHGLGYGNMYRDAWTGEEWFIKKILAPYQPKIIFDVGANIGNYSKLLLHHTEAEIYAFEPNPSSFAELAKLDERVTKVNVALAEEVGEATLYFKKDFDGMASLDSRIRRGNEVQVRVDTIETYATKQAISEIDYVKIDTEGFEKEVIMGLGVLRPAFIQMEFNVNHLQRSCTFLEITELLPGYDFYRLLPNGWLRIKPEKYLSNIFMFSNVVAVRQA